VSVVADGLTGLRISLGALKSMARANSLMGMEITNRVVHIEPLLETELLHQVHFSEGSWSRDYARSNHSKGILGLYM
jgi:hypothetical protein